LATNFASMYTIVAGLLCLGFLKLGTKQN